MKNVSILILFLSTSIYAAENSSQKKSDFWHAMFKNTMKQQGNQDLALVYCGQIVNQNYIDHEYVMLHIGRAIVRAKRKLRN